MAPLPHPTWPPRWVVVWGSITFAVWLGGILFLIYTVAHFIWKFW